MLKTFRIQNTTLREFLAELLGTFVLICIGCSINAAVLVSKTDGATLINCFGWGLAVTAAIYVCGGVSGGHLNPAVSIGLASVGKLKWIQLPHYFAGQYLGAFFGAAVTYCVYYNAITNIFGPNLMVTGKNATAGIFGTFPNPHVSSGTCFLDVIVGTSVFMLLILAIIDKKNMNCEKGLLPIAIGFIALSLVLFAFGFNCGGPMNPARDLSPRLLSLIAGWGPEVFSIRNYNYFWIPIIATHLGGIIGSWIYVLLIENNWPEKENDSIEGDETNKNKEEKNP